MMKLICYYFIITRKYILYVGVNNLVFNKIEKMNIWQVHNKSFRIIHKKNVIEWYFT